jgi:hypothetical protein
MLDIERMKYSGILSKILKSSPKDRDVENQILVVCYSFLTDRGFGGWRYFDFQCKEVHGVSNDKS